MSTLPPPPPGWYPDPAVATGALRYWTGGSWSGQVVVPGAAAKGREAHPTLPLVVAFGALVSLAVPLVASRFILRSLATYRWPIAVYVVLVAVIGYGPPLLFWRYASRRWGSGAWRADVGLTARWVDAGWGPLTWLACFGTQIIVGVIVVQTHIPIQSNTEGIRQARHNTGYVVPLLITAVIAAPIVEEIISGSTPD